MGNKPKENLVCIFRTPYVDEVAIIESLLKDGNIPYFIENYTFASLGSMDGSINYGIMVQTNYKQEAEELLKEFIKPTSMKESLITKKEIETRHKEKYALAYLILTILGLFVGIGFFLSVVFTIQSGVLKKEISSVVGGFIFMIVCGAAGLFIMISGLREIKLLLGLLRKKYFK